MGGRKVYRLSPDGQDRETVAHHCRDSLQFVVIATQARPSLEPSTVHGDHCRSMAGRGGVKQWSISIGGYHCTCYVQAVACLPAPAIFSLRIR